MKRKMRKKKQIISLLLVLCMTLGMIPSVSLAGQEEGKDTTQDLVYNFLKCSEYYNPGKQWTEFKQTGTAFSQITDLQQTTKGSAQEINAESSIITEPWCFVKTTAKDEQSPHYQWGGMYSFADGAGTCLQMKILAKAGTYTAITAHTKNYYAPCADVFLAPVTDAENATAEKYKIGSVDPSVSWAQCPTNKNGPIAGDWTASEFTLGDVTLEDGEYLLTYQYSKDGMNKANKYFAVAGFTLKKHAEAQPDPKPEPEPEPEPSGETIPRNLVYNFHKLSGEYATEGDTVLIQSVTALSQTTAGSEDEILPTSTQKTDPWCYVAASEPEKNFRYNGGNGVVLNANEARGGWATFKIQVPADGLYDAVSVNFHYYQSGLTQIFLAPIDAKEPMAEEYSLGIINATRKWSNATEDQKYWYMEDPLDKPVSLKKGEYLLSYLVRTDTSSSYANTGWQYFFSRFHLNWVQEANLSVASFGEIITGKSADAAVTLTAKDGFTHDLQQVTLGVQSDNPNIAKAAISGTTLNISGLARGKTNVCVYAKIGDQIIATTTIPITVSDPVYIETEAVSPVLTGYEKTAKVSLRTDSSDYDISKAVLEAELSDPSIAEVSIADKTLTIKGLKEGKSDLIIRAKLDGEQIGILTQELSVLDPLAIHCEEFSDIEIESYMEKVLSLEIQDEAGFKESDLVLEAKSENDTVAVAALENKVLRISGVAVGETSVTVTAKYQDKVIQSLTIPVKIKEKDISGDLKAEFLKTVPIGKTQSVALHLMKHNGAAYPLDGIEFSANIGNHELATAVVKQSGEQILLEVSGVKEGRTWIALEAKKADKVIATTEVIATITADAESSGKDLVYDFHKLGKWYVEQSGSYGDAVDIATVKSFGQTLAGAPDEINKGSSIVTDPWYFIDTSAEIPGKFRFNSKVNGIFFDGDATKGGYASFMIHVPADGIYEVVNRNAHYYKCGRTEIFLAPEDAADPQAAQYSLGVLDVTRKWSNATIDAENWMLEDSLGYASVKAGNYCLTYKVLEKTSSTYSNTGWQYFVSAFLLKAVSFADTPITISDVGTLKAGNRAEAAITVHKKDGTELDLSVAEFSAESKNPEILKADIVRDEENSIPKLSLQGLRQGQATVAVAMLIQGQKVLETEIPIFVAAPGTLDRVALSVKDNSANQVSVGVVGELEYQLYDTDGEQLTNEAIALQNPKFTYECLTPKTATVTQKGQFAPIAEGEIVIRLTATLSGISKTGEIHIKAHRGKIERTFYTDEKIEAARENIEKYSWARSIRDAAVKRSEPYVGKEEALWNLVTPQSIPRAITVGVQYDPKAYSCRYCGVDLRSKYGQYPWLLDPLGEPWKIQCPDCRRKFPSNDFEKYYELGLDEHGIFQPELAKEKNAELLANGEDGYLKNILYPEMDEKLGVTNWGVDDGMGYKPGKTCENGAEEIHSYIAYYNHWGIWYSTSVANSGVLYNAVTGLRDAYLYTGEERYGRTGAILLDRIADVYPDFDLIPYSYFYLSPGLKYEGKVLNKVWETSLARTMVYGYDAFYNVYEDPYVINFLSQKASEYQLENTKLSVADIRRNGEDNILREVYRECKSGQINGNFGMHQSTLALTAVVLNTFPESREMIDWVMQAGERLNGERGAPVTGGNVLPQIMGVVNRDGIGNEVAPQYNDFWLTYIKQIADILNGWDGYPAADLYSNPKVMKMFTALGRLTLCGRTTAQLGDSKSTANKELVLRPDLLLDVFNRTGDITCAQLCYFANGNSTDGLHLDIFSKDAESIRNQVRQVVEEHGGYDYGNSDQLAGYGFSILRDGELLKTANESNTLDTQRDFWISYAHTAYGHGHLDALNLGIHAFGLDMAPDFGYPESGLDDENSVQWAKNTISHNTVMVDGIRQTGLKVNGTPLHFDDSGRVKVMDVDAEKAYAAADIYRRTLVMVEVSDEVSYGVDFFRIRGGNEHLYSFHSQSNQIVETEGLNLVQQEGGSYAGADIPWGANSKYLNGYTWLRNVRRAANVKNFSVDFKVTDFKNVLGYPTDTNLRMTMLNDFDLTEVAIAEGMPPRIADNAQIPYFEYVLAKRKGTKLDSLFTTVYEPYKNERYIEGMEPVSVTAKEGESTDAVRAVKVVHTNGRVDYIVYSANNDVTYRVDDLFDFKGFVGVYTLKDGEPIYTYLNDGTQIGNTTMPQAAVTGTVSDFTRDFVTENYITIQPDAKIDPENLAGRWMTIQNDGTENAAYQIQHAVSQNDGTVMLELGNVTPIRAYKSKDDINQGYTYNIEEGQKFRIPLSINNDSAPIFTPIEDKNVEAGSELKFQVVAESPAGRELTYSENTLPRGAQFNPETQTFSWIPDSSQIGDTFVAIDATDGAFTKTLYIKVRVYNSASHGGDKPIDNPSQGTGNNGNNNQGEVDPPVVTAEEDEVKFAASTEETTAESKLGSVTFTDGTFAEGGQGTLNIKKENEKFNISVSATVDMEERPAKVSLNYTPADNMTDKNCIVVKDANGNIIPNGRYADGKMTFYTDTFGDFTIVYNPKSFTDLGNHAWADDAITRLAARGIINGITRATYGPARNITRADFTTLIVRAFGFEGEVASFADVPANAYYAEPVGIAKTLGIVGGVNESDFAPTAEITRQDMMVIVARALDKAGYVLDASDSPAFSDTAEVADYAKDAVQMLTASGIIAGSNGKINPKGKTTRAEVAVILDRILFMAR